MILKKTIFVISFLAIFGLLFNFGLPNVKAMTTAELQDLIDQLLQQVAELQQQLAETEDEGEEWCHNFNVNLGHGSTGSEVEALQIALEKQNLYQGESSYFDEQVASAVTGFQKKYREDVLASWGLSHGTGYVGNTTRDKLNELYGCVEEEVYITVTSPNGGERWEIEQTYDITWDSSGLDEVNISLRGNGTVNSEVLECYLNKESISAELGIFKFKLNNCTAKIFSGGFPGIHFYQEKYPKTISISPGSDYEIKIIDANYEPGSGYIGTSDSSDDYFSIVPSEETCHTSPLWSWNYCSPTCQCFAGEGDCDKDSDCATGYCAQNVGVKYGQVSSMDVCEGEEIATPLYKTEWDDASLYDTLYKSEDNGQTWKEIFHQYKGHIIYVTDSKNPSIIYAGDKGGNLMAENMDIDLLKSTDAGEHWKDILKGIIDQTDVNVLYGLYSIDSLWIDHDNSDIIKVTVRIQQDKSITFKSLDGGNTWIEEIVPSITVISPNGGERWEIGKTYDITWESKGIEKEFQIMLHRDYDSSNQWGTKIAQDIPIGTKEYLWTIPSFIKDGDNYQIEVQEMTSLWGALEMIRDFSDNHFAIIPEATENLPPVIDGLTAPTQLKVNEEGTWTVKAHDPESGPLTYLVNWGDEYAPIFDQKATEENVTVQTTTFNHSYSKAGTFVIGFTIRDDRQQVVKTSTTINIVTEEKPDLVPSCIDLELGTCPSITNDNEKYLKYNYNIWNNGNKDSSSFTVKTYLNGIQRTTINYTEGLKIGSHLNEDLCFSGYEIGENIMKIIVDCDKEVDESNENNNESIGIINIVPETCHTSDLWSWDYCSSDCQCSVGEGDCDMDSDCTTGYCAQNVGAKYGQVSSMDVCEEKEMTTCTDSDGGKNYYVKGTASTVSTDGNATIKIDWCNSNWWGPDNLSSTGSVEHILNECYCGQDGYIYVENYTCPYGCENGACIKEESIVSPCPPFGDVDLDGDLDSDDAQLIANYTVGSIILTSEQMTRADVNNDGATNIVDSMLISQYVEGIIDTFPVCEPEKSITVVSPNRRETLYEGDNYKINWDASNLPIDAKIYITLFRTGETNIPIVSNLPSTQREYTWLVTGSGDWAFGYEYEPSLFAKILGIKEVKAAGCSYQIMVSANWGTYDTGYYGNTYDKSDEWFSIISTEKSITVLSPNGGERWEYNKSYPIQYQSNGITKVGLKYLKGSQIFYESGPASVDSTISHFVNPSRASITGAGDDYKVRVYDWDNPQIYDESDASFSILPFITVTSPSIGDQWLAGNTYDITWESQGVDKVKIYLENLDSGLACINQCQPPSGSEEVCCDPCGLQLIAENVLASQGKYSWKTPTTTISIAKIIIKNTLVNGCPTAENNKSFSLISSSTTTSSVDIESQLASISETISRIAEELKKLLK